MDLRKLGRYDVGGALSVYIFRGMGLRLMIRVGRCRVWRVGVLGVWWIRGW